MQGPGVTACPNFNKFKYNKTVYIHKPHDTKQCTAPLLSEHCRDSNLDAVCVFSKFCFKASLRRDLWQLMDYGLHFSLREFPLSSHTLPVVNIGEQPQEITLDKCLLLTATTYVKLLKENK